MFRFIKRWLTFSKERFPLPRHTLLVIFYVCANALAAFSSVSLSAAISYKEVLCFFSVWAIFFHLRIFDEIKDYKKDSMIHKQRPLARGLVSVREAKQVAIILITLELFFAFLISRAAFIAAVCTILYSVVMYKEFFIGNWLRPKMATYALMHTLVSCWMSVFIFSAVTNLNLWKIPKIYGMFVLANWMIFNIFEFGRKTLGKDEELELVESYSKQFGPIRAALNIIIMATVAIFVAYRLGTIFNLNLFYAATMYLLYGLTLIVASLYAVHNNRTSARIFRGICSIFILFYNVIIAFAIFAKGVL